MEGESGPICERVERSTPEIRELVSPTGGMEDGSLFVQLDELGGIRLPTLQPNSELSVEGEAGSSIANSGHALLAQPVMVSISTGDVNGLPTLLESMPRHPDEPNRDQPSVSRERLDTPNRLESIRNCLQREGFPPDVVRLLLAATRKNSDAAYQSSWALWRDWCLRRDVDPLSVGIAEILKFLSESFSEGKSYSTLNVQRSMLSSTLNFAPSGLKDVGKHPLITRFFKGIYNSRPPVPRYVNTWDPATILTYFDSRASASLSLIQLARKTATLLALTTILRCSELTSIQKQSVIISETEASFILGNPRKAQKSGALHKISVRSWLDNRTICPVKCLEQYLEATRPHRNKDNDSQLFIGANKPHRSVSSSTVGRWIKDQLKETGINTAIFSAHSVRGAASSKAAAAGVPIQSILNQGHWASESTFAKFYRREKTKEKQIDIEALLQVSGDDSD